MRKNIKSLGKNINWERVWKGEGLGKIKAEFEEAISLGRSINFIAGVYEVAYSHLPFGEEYQVVWKNIKSLGKDIQSLGKNMKHLGEKYEAFWGEYQVFGKNMESWGENI